MVVETKRTLELRYELDGMQKVEVVFYPKTMIGKLKEHMQKKLAELHCADMTLFYGDVELDATKRMRDYNIGEGAVLTLKYVFTLPPASPSPEPEPEPEVSQMAPAPGAKRKREDSASPEPGDMQKTPRPSPKLKWASVKAPV